MNEVLIAIIDELNELKIKSLNGKRGGDYRIGLTHAIQTVTSYIKNDVNNESTD